MERFAPNSSNYGNFTVPSQFLIVNNYIPVLVPMKLELTTKLVGISFTSLHSV